MAQTYVPLSDEDRRWAASTHIEEGQVFRGPCGPLLNWVDSTVDNLRQQPPMKNVLLFFGICLVMFLVNELIEDETVMVLVHGGKKCASPRDLLDIENKRCRVEDKLAKSFLGGERWLKCADFTRGAATLLSSVDDAGRYWYPVKDKREVAMFYSTCNPTCASLADEYHADVPSCDQGVCDGGMCKVRDANAVAWIEGKKTGSSFPGYSSAGAEGYSCRESPRTRPGLDAITSATASAVAKGKAAEGEYYYDPERSYQVRAFFAECAGPCACNDFFDVASGRCSLEEPRVRALLSRDAPPESVLAGGGGCARMGGELQSVRRRGGLQGGRHAMTYLPGVKDDVRKIYQACAAQAPCPGISGI